MRKGRKRLPGDVKVRNYLLRMYMCVYAVCVHAYTQISLCIDGNGAGRMLVMDKNSNMSAICNAWGFGMIT